MANVNVHNVNVPVPEDENLPTAKEITHRCFGDVKQQFKFSEAVLVEEAKEMKALEKAALRCADAVEKREPKALQEATNLCRKALGDMQNSLALATEQQENPPVGRSRRRRCAPSEETPLQNWRPSFSGTVEAPERTKSEQASPKGDSPTTALSSIPEGSEQDGSAERATSSTSSVLSGLLERKNKADTFTKDGAYHGGLKIYEELLDEANDSQEMNVELIVALLCNTALCCLKLSSAQATWAHAKGLLRRTLGLCDKALSLAPRSSKAHFRRGCALEALERHTEAVEAYERASDLEPQDPRIRKAYARSVRYLQYEQGPERAKKIERLVRDQGFKSASSRPAALRKVVACCRCGAEVKGEGYFALPCSHGPFCGQCKALLDRDNGGLIVCTVCKQHPSICTRSMGVIERWEVGMPEETVDEARLRAAASGHKAAPQPQNRPGSQGGVPVYTDADLTAARKRPDSHGGEVPVYTEVAQAVSSMDAVQRVRVSHGVECPVYIDDFNSSLSSMD